MQTSAQCGSTLGSVSPPPLPVRGLALNLSHRAISSIAPNGLRGAACNNSIRGHEYYNVSYVLLNNNQLTEIPQLGTTFFASNFTVVILDGNNISGFSDAFAVSVPSWANSVFVSLRLNTISSLPSQAFGSFQGGNVLRVDLSDNLISSIESDTFDQVFTHQVALRPTVLPCAL